MDNRKKFIYLGLVLVVVLVVASVYEHQHKQPAKPAALTTKNATNNAPATNPFITATPPPAGFPADLPLANSSTMTINYATKVSSRNLFVRGFSTPDNIDSLYTTFKQYFVKSKTWTLVTDTNGATSKILAGKSGQNFLNIALQADAINKTLTDINITYSAPQ